MLEIIRREAVYLWYYLEIQLKQILPYFLLGIFLGSVISVFVKDRIHGLFRSLGNKKLGFLGIIAASVLGIASPLCMYGTIPLAASFSKSGIRDDWLAAFMMSSILLNPQLIIYSTALGGTALAIRIGSCFLCGIAAGILVRIFYKNKTFFDFTGFEEPKSRDADPNLFIRLLKNIGRNFKATALWFFIGVVLSVLFQRYVPSELVGKLFGKNEGPRRAYSQGVEGRVVCGFIVNPDGAISHVSVVRGVNDELNREAVRVISSMPRWEPGVRDGAKVPVYCCLTIPFRL